MNISSAEIANVVMTLRRHGRIRAVSAERLMGYALLVEAGYRPSKRHCHQRESEIGQRIKEAADLQRASHSAQVPAPLQSAEGGQPQQPGTQAPTAEQHPHPSPQP